MMEDVHGEGACRVMFIAAAAQCSGSKHRESGGSDQRVSIRARARAKGGGGGWSGNMLGGRVDVDVVVVVVAFFIRSDTLPGDHKSRVHGSIGGGGCSGWYPLTRVGVRLCGRENSEHTEIRQLASMLISEVM